MNAGLRVLCSGPGPGPATETTHLLSTYIPLRVAFCHFQLSVLSANWTTLHPGGAHRHRGSPAGPPTRAPQGAQPEPQGHWKQSTHEAPGPGVEGRLLAVCAFRCLLPTRSNAMVFLMAQDTASFSPWHPWTSAMRAPNPAGDSVLSGGRAWLQAVWEVGMIDLAGNGEDSLGDGASVHLRGARGGVPVPITSWKPAM